MLGINCPRAPRQIADQTPGEPFGKEALLFTKELVMQREVEVEVENVDKGGNFIGWLYIEGKNLSITLVEEGLSKVLPQAERSSYGKELFDVEEKARAARKNVWEDYVEPQPQEDEGEVEGAGEEEQQGPPPERKCDYQKVVITEVVSCNRFWAQLVDQGPRFEEMMKQLRSDLTANPPLAGAFTPKKGTTCVAQFSDGLWYRATVEKVVNGQAHVLYIDYGNREVVPSSKLAAIPAGYSGLPPQGKEYYLACVIPPNDEDWYQEALSAFNSDVMDQVMLLNVEYRSQGQEYVTLQTVTDNLDLGEKLIREGLLRAERRKEKRLSKLVAEYVKVEEEARKNRKNMWCYGDFTPDDAREFGYQKP